MDMQRRFPFVWVTWITGLLSGDKHCKFAAWYKSHYEFDRRHETPERAAKLSTWKGDHADMVADEVRLLRDIGWTVTVEGQNKFTVKGATAILGGGPDIVAVRDRTIGDINVSRGIAIDGNLPLIEPEPEGTIVKEALVVDAKTGQRRDSDFWQVLCYMTFLPSTYQAVKHRTLSGEVVYRDGRLPIAAGTADDAAKGRIYALMRELGGATPLEATPSGGECGWCDLASCPHRVEPDEPVTTEDF